MVSQEERLKILKMVQDGKLSAEQGIQLLQALKEPAKPAAPAVSQFTPPPTAPVRAAHWLRVTVTDTNTGKVRVNVRLPITVLTAGVKMGARFSTEIEGLNLQELMDLARTGEVGRIVDIFDEEDGEHVEVYLE